MKPYVHRYRVPDDWLLHNRRAVLMGREVLRTIGRARASFAMTMMAACYKRLVYFQAAGIEAF